MELGRYSFGIGDRFGRQGRAQLEAIAAIRGDGFEVTPVWNKSHREHSIIGTTHADVRAEADAAVAALGWKHGYFVDADHIGMGTVDRFIEPSDFFTLDVADFTGKPADTADIDAFVSRHRDITGSLQVMGIDEPFALSEESLRKAASKYLLAVKEAGRIYRHVLEAKGKDAFIAEVSMDETDMPQSPEEMLLILAMIADEGIPAQTIAPRFSGRFNKGVDYVGDVDQFTAEFESDLLVIAHAIREFGLPRDLKLSVHSGSDKFAIYPRIGQATRKHNTGVHVKTAGTTWLEELIGLAAAEGEGVAIVKEVYRKSLARREELCGPYAQVIDIDQNRLPPADEVDTWKGADLVDALRHDQSCERYNMHMRQMLHVGYKVAAEMDERFYRALDEYAESIAANVTENIYARHLKRLLLPT